MRTCFAALFLMAASCGISQAAPIVGTGGGDPGRDARAAQLTVQADPAPSTGDPVAPPPREKSLASGLYMSGTFTYVLTNGSANITLDQINNDSYTLTTGTLRLTLWALTYQPSRGASINGYKMATFATFNPLSPRNYYYAITRSAGYVSPPNGTYWLILVLEQYDPSACPSNSDGFCLEDTFQSFVQVTFGPATPAYNYSDLWWNSSESGWGVVVEHHTSNIAFIAWYTYDGAGNPKWYVGPNCPMIGNGCSSTLYETTGPPFGPTFNPAQVSARSVGSVTFSFTDRNSGYMSYNVNGISAVKSITRQPF